MNVSGETAYELCLVDGAREQLTLVGFKPVEKKEGAVTGIKAAATAEPLDSPNSKKQRGAADDFPNEDFSDSLTMSKALGHPDSERPSGFADEAGADEANAEVRILVAVAAAGSI